MIIKIKKNNQEHSQIELSSEIEGLDSGHLSFLIGRSSECHIQLDDKMVSREHIKLTYQDLKWNLDQISNSGSFKVNGVTIRSSILKNDDVITIGSFSLTCSFSENEIEAIKSVSIEDVSSENEVAPSELLEQEDDFTKVASPESLLNEKESSEEISSDDSSTDSNSENFSDSENLFDEDSNEGINEDVNEISDEDNNDADFGDDTFDSNDEGLGDEGQDGYGLEEFDDEKTQVFSGFSSFRLEIFGEYAPYDNFKIELSEVFIGRDSQKCQIVLNDPEVSSVHAVIRKTNMSCVLEDLNSGNGTLLQGKRINKVTLENRDEFVIGSTTFTIQIESSFLVKEKDRLMPVEQNQSVEVEEIVEVGADFDGDGEDLVSSSSSSNSLFSKDALKDPEKRKKLLIGLVIIFGLWTLFEDEDSGTKVDPKKVKKVKQDSSKARLMKKFSPEELEFLSSTYELSKELHNSGRYSEAMVEMEKILPMDKNYKNLLQLYELSKLGLKRLEEQERERQAEIERKLRLKKIADLVVKARAATKEKNVEVAESLFEQIIILDPNNIDITLLKRELNSWKKEQERIALEKAQKEAERKRQVRLLKPGGNYYLKEEWHNAILKLEDYLKLKDIDEDLVKKATDMFNLSKQNLEEKVNPLLGKARSLREGQDLKGAYEIYKEILVFHPNHREAMVEMDDIRERLVLRSKKSYREAIISESLSLFQDAKEKLQEVQQISPTDSEYYEKATEKLKQYLE